MDTENTTPAAAKPSVEWSEIAKKVKRDRLIILEAQRLKDSFPVMERQPLYTYILTIIATKICEDDILS